MNKKSLEDFTIFFLSICKNNGSNHLNLDLFKEYIYLMLPREIYDIPNSFILIDKKINLIIRYMLNEGLVKRIEMMIESNIDIRPSIMLSTI